MLRLGITFWGEHVNASYIISEALCKSESEIMSYGFTIVNDEWCDYGKIIE